MSDVKCSDVTSLKYTTTRSFKDFEWLNTKLNNIKGLRIYCNLPKQNLFTGKGFSAEKTKALENYAIHLLRYEGCKKLAVVPFSECDEPNAMRKALWLARAFFGFSSEEFEMVRHQWSKSDQNGFDFHESLKQLGSTMVKLNTFHKWCRFKIEDCQYDQRTKLLGNRKDAQDHRKINELIRITKETTRRKELDQMCRNVPKIVE